MAQIPRATASVAAGGFGRTFLLGGTAVAAGLGGFYLNMLNNKDKEQAAGANPYHEQVVAQLSKKNVDTRELRPLNSHYSNIPPAFPGKEHNSGHMTIRDSKNSPDYSHETRNQVPPPQRGKSDGSGGVYTKSPDYNKNYEKTERGKPKVAPVTA